MTRGQTNRSSVQFSIRGVMAVTVLVGVLCAVVMPLLQAWPFEKRWQFIGFLTVSLLAAAAIVGLLSLRRRYVERMCGDVRLRVTLRGSGMLYVYYLLLGGLMLADLVFCAYVFVDSSIDSWGSVSLSVVGAVAPVTLIPQAFVFLWWGPNVWSLELRERGLVFYGLYFRLWKDFLGYAWVDDPPSQLQVEVRGATIGARVGKHQQPLLTSILDDVHASGKQLMDR